MQTPFEILINQKNKRKEKIHQSLSPKRQGVTFSVQNAFRPKTMQSQSKSNLHNKQNKNTKSAIQQIKLDLCKALPQQKSVQWIRNKGKRSQQLRLSFTKTDSLKGQYKLFPEQNPQKKVLIIEGNHYNKDLIKLNKKKLEELINKIQNKSRVKFKKNIVEQANLSKQKINRLKKRQKSNLKGKTQIPKVQGHKFQNFQQANNRKNSANNENKYLHIFQSVGLENEFKVTNYLRCNSLLKEGEVTNNQLDNCSLVLDSSKVLAFLRNVKKLKKTSLQTPQLVNRQKNPLAQRSKACFHSFQKNSKQSLSQRGNHRQIDVLKKSNFSVKTSPIKTKINEINFDNLEGWESTDLNNDFALANFSLLE